MGVLPKIIHFNNRIFHYKPSILGYPHVWKPPSGATPKHPACFPRNKLRLMPSVVARGCGSCVCCSPNSPDEMIPWIGLRDFFPENLMRESMVSCRF